MRILLALLLASSAGCLDFAVLGTPLDGGGNDAPVSIDATSTPDLIICTGTTGGPEECQHPSDCRLGYTCVSFLDGPGQCLLLCDSDKDCQCARSRCILPPGGGDKFCSRFCDLALQTGCPQSSGCDIFDADGDMGAYLACRGVGATPVGAACSNNSDCANGAVCVGTCAAWCDNDVKCPQPQKCMAVIPPANFYGVTYGVCQ